MEKKPTVPKANALRKHKFFDELKVGEREEIGESSRDLQQRFGSIITQRNRRLHPKKFVGRNIEGKFYIYRDNDVN